MTTPGRLAGRLRRRLAPWVAAALHHSGAMRLLNAFVNHFEVAPVRRGGLRSVRRRRARCFQILTYHRVGEAGDPFLSARPTPVFRRQMAYLAEHCRVVALERALDALERGELEENTVVVTFDDGYRDNYLNAFPVLRELSLPATIFLVTDTIGSGRILWHDRVFRAFHETRVASVREFGPARLSFELDAPDSRRAARDAVLGMLKGMGPEDRLRWIDGLADKLEVDVSRDVPGLMLDWDEVREMHAAGISFGAHTVSHPILSRIPAAQARREIVESKREIERRLGVPVRTFAYPNGKREDFNAEHKAALREEGFRCAVTTIDGSNARSPVSGADPMELRRIGISVDPISLFALRLNLGKLS